MNIKIGIDIDEVALKYVQRLNEVFRLFGGKTDISNPRQYDIYKSIRRRERDCLMQANAYLMNEELDFYHDFTEVIKYLIDNNQDLRFITSRRKDLAHDSARKSLGKAIEFACNGYIPYFTIDCIKGSKLKKAQEYQLEYFVDDKRSTCLELAEAGIFVFMPKRSYNSLPQTKNIYQYDNAREIIDFFS